MKEYLETGKVVGTHGIRGDLKIECWCDDNRIAEGPRLSSGHSRHSAGTICIEESHGKQVLLPVF